MCAQQYLVSDLEIPNFENRPYYCASREFILTPTYRSYRHNFNPKAKGADHPDNYIKKPFGYSLFPKEIMPCPVSWVAKTGNLVWSNTHDRGGHFAALEQPELLWGDIEAFAAAVWKK